MGEAFLEVAHVDPAEIVVEIPEVRGLPIGDRDDRVALVHEVPRPGVALHQDHRPRTVGRKVASEPPARELDEEVVLRDQPILRLPPVDLLDHMLSDRRRHAQLGQVERSRVDAMQRGDLFHECGGQRHLGVDIGHFREPIPAVDPPEEERFLGGVHRDQRCDHHR